MPTYPADPTAAPEPPESDPVNPTAHAPGGPPAIAPAEAPASASEAAPAEALAATPEPPVIPVETPKLPEPLPFRFHGDEREYFRLWIVNTLLTLLSLGLFAAWAKVRKRRYFRGNTEFMGHRFDYLADPRRILLGNLIVAVLFLAYAVVGEVYAPVRFTALGLALLLLPWIVVRSLAFNAHNTTYRGLRFYFRQTYAIAAYTYLIQALLTVLSLGLYYPAWVRNRRQFIVGNHRLGGAYFHLKAPAGRFYASYLIAGCLVLGAGILGGFVTTALQSGSGGRVESLAELIPFFLIYGAMFFLAKHYLYARLFNHVWNHTRLDDHRFLAAMPVGGWLNLQLRNLAAILLSAGLLYPWAAVRSARYALGCLQLAPSGVPLERIERLGRQQGSAIGETAGEFIGLDLGL
jgi:uncharacterized membrane protein YjgN (DUF898 family)